MQGAVSHRGQSPLNVLFVVEHYYRASEPNPLGLASLGPDPAPRVAAVERALQSLHACFRRPHLGADFGRAAPIAANTRGAVSADIVVCTSGDEHLLGAIAFPRSLYQHVVTRGDPLFLGFDCLGVLRDGLSRYDYFCFLEDDIVVNDPWLFDKVRWFSERHGETSVLMPNRYEMRGPTPEAPVPAKVYIDMELAPEMTAAFQDVGEIPEVTGEHLGVSVVFRRPRNPHAACFFLSRPQMEHWTRQPHFMDRDTIWIDPLVSASTLGPMRTFRLYKPGYENADFLEVLHHGEAWSQRLLTLARKAGALR
jgi:hypothetical protein